MSELSTIDVIILCGGKGQRLRAAVPGTQKVMAPVHNQPFLDLILGYLHRQGLRRVILATGHRSEDVEERYRQGFKGLTVDVSREEEPLGTGGAVKKALELVRSPQVFVLNGDCFCAIDYAALLAEHQKTGAAATLVVSVVEDAADFGTITVAPDGRIQAFQEKMADHAPRPVNAGIYCFSSDIAARMPAQAKFSIERDFFPRLIGGAFYGFVVREPFLDIGTPERFQKAQEFLKQRGL